MNKFKPGDIVRAKVVRRIEYEVLDKECPRKGVYWVKAFNNKEYMAPEDKLELVRRAVPEKCESIW